MLSDFFQLSTVPANAMHGTYQYSLVALSYIIAVLASYVALDFVGRLRDELYPRARIFWLLGGAFAMGAGIWSMHFIGMLSYIMPMPMDYQISWTISSLFVAIIASSFALFILRSKDLSRVNVAIGGIFIGLGIATMHYMGMQSMAAFMNIHYLPSLFILSIVIALVAAEAALWLALESNQGTPTRQFNLKIVSALIMGAAICGMHYTGMAAAVFTPLANPKVGTEFIQTDALAFFVAGVTGFIITLALTVSTYYRLMIKAVQTEKEFLKAMLNNLEDGIIACDAHGRITVLNHILHKEFSLQKSSTAMDLSAYFELYPLDSATPINNENNPLMRALRGERIHAMEYVMDVKNGYLLNVVINGQPILDVHGNKVGAVIAIHDVTKLKTTEKLKNEFVSIVSHELRTPLTSIRGSLGLILGGAAGEVSEKIKKLLEIANNNSERLTRLINDILDIEKIEAGKMNFVFQPLDINSVVEDAINATKPIADKGQVGFQFLPTEKIMVNGDYDRLMQVMVNLLSNAIRYSPPGKNITIEINKEEGMTRVSVKDQGEGIPEEFTARIFQKFSQADSSSSRSKGGTGLGLSICKAIIEKHHGDIHFDSKKNEGTCFYFDLPNMMPVTTGAKPADALDKSEAIRLLICDSNPDSARFLKAFLKKHKVASDVAFTAEKARELLKTNTYNAMTLDLILSDCNGIKLINEIRREAKTQFLPIVIISTAGEESKKELNGNGFPIIDWIEKPANPDQLRKIIDYIREHFIKSKPQILCVEDDPDVTKILNMLLQDEAKMWNAPTIKTAKKLLEQEPFDLVILDLRLPDGMGTDILPCTNKLTKKIIPVIVFSAYELDKKYAHLVKASLLKSKVSNEQLFSIIHSAISSVDIPEKAPSETTHT